MFDWSNWTFILGNIVGAIVKAKPNTIPIFRDKLIPYWIFASQLVAQFIAGLGLGGDGGAQSSVVAPAGIALAGIGFGMFGKVLWDSCVQTAISVLLNQLKRQGSKPE